MLKVSGTGRSCPRTSCDDISPRRSGGPARVSYQVGPASRFEASEHPHDARGFPQDRRLWSCAALLFRPKSSYTTDAVTLAQTTRFTFGSSASTCLSSWETRRSQPSSRSSVYVAPQATPAGWGLPHWRRRFPKWEDTGLKPLFDRRFGGDLL